MSKVGTILKLAKQGGRMVLHQGIKHAPGILMAIGTVGVLVGVGTAIKKAPEAKKEFDSEKEKWDAVEDKENRVKADYIFKQVRIGLKHYWVVVLIIGGSITCFWVANHISFKRLMSALTALGITTKSKEELEQKVKDLDGEAHLGKIKDEIAKDKLKEAPGIDTSKDPREYGPGESWFYEPGSRQYFRSNYECIKQSINNIRYDLKSQILDGNSFAFVPMNEFFLDIGAESCDFGSELGFGIMLNSKDISEKQLIEMIEEACNIGFTSAFDKSGIPVGVIKYECKLANATQFCLE